MQCRLSMISGNFDFYHFFRSIFSYHQQFQMWHYSKSNYVSNYDELNHFYIEIIIRFKEMNKHLKIWCRRYSPSSTRTIGVPATVMPSKSKIISIINKSLGICSGNLDLSITELLMRKINWKLKKKQTKKTNLIDIFDRH